jgi:hypothetical protein
LFYLSFVARSDPGKKARAFVYLSLVKRSDPGKKARIFVYLLFVARSGTGKKAEHLSIWHFWQDLILEKS